MDELTGPVWHTSSYSGSNGAQCVEVAAWRTSSYSSANGGECVEVGVARAASVVGIRDSKDREGGTLIVTPAGWCAFVADVRAGRAG